MATHTEWPQSEGHKDVLHYSVYVWLTNYEPHYNMMRYCLRYTPSYEAGAQMMFDYLKASGEQGPDGCEGYTLSTVLEAIKSIEEVEL